MANPLHLAQFLQGVASWNRWRKNHPEIQPDLSEITVASPDKETLRLFGKAQIFEVRIFAEPIWPV